MRYAEALECGRHHVVIKNAVKEIAWSKGKAVTFMAKYDALAAGSSATCTCRSGRSTASPPSTIRASPTACRG